MAFIATKGEAAVKVAWPHGIVLPQVPGAQAGKGRIGDTLGTQASFPRRRTVPERARTRSTVRVAGGVTPSFSSSRQMASAPTCDRGFCSSRARTARTRESSFAGVRLATRRGTRERSLAHPGSLGS